MGLLKLTAPGHALRLLPLLLGVLLLVLASQSCCAVQAISGIGSATGAATGSAETARREAVRQAEAALAPDADGSVNDVDAVLAWKLYNTVAQDEDEPLSPSPARAAALCGLAAMLEHGDTEANIEADVHKAVDLYLQAAALGNATAQFVAGVLHATGLFGVPHDEARAVLLYHQAALGGNVKAQMTMGYRYEYGIGVPKRCSTSVMYYELAASQAVQHFVDTAAEAPNVKQRLSDEIIDKLGSGGDPSMDVLQYYMDAANTGDLAAQVTLGHLRYYGAKGLRRDFKRAARWFSLASEQQDGTAMAHLGHMYLHGLGVEQDDASASTLFTAAAEQGVAAAVTGLGYMHLYGRGVEQSTPKAVEHFKRATEAGNADAMYNLGYMALTGTGLKRDFQRALSEFSRAAQRGHILAQHKLAEMHANAIGTQASCSKASKLFSIVAQRGPWVRDLHDAREVLAHSKTEQALLAYAKAAEIGYEVAQWNAAWLLDRHIATGAPSTSGPWRDTVAYTLEAPSEGGDSSDSPSDGGDSSADNEDGEVSVERASESAALRLFEKSAQLGHVASHLRMGDYHYYGRAGLEPDPTKAMDHYQAAAERKNPQAMFNMAHMHEYGIGVSSDPHLAKRYYDMALQTSPKAYVAVRLATTTMRVRQWVLSVWESWFGGAEAAEEEAGEVEIEAVGVTEAEATPSPSEELKDRVLNAVKGDKHQSGGGASSVKAWLLARLAQLQAVKARDIPALILARDTTLMMVLLPILVFLMICFCLCGRHEEAV